MSSSKLNSILYVDDDTELRAVVKTVLTVLGNFTVRACGSGRAALEEATKFGPDLLLLDVVMPDMDGPATLAELRKLQKTAHTPVMFITSNVQAQDLERYKTLGAIGVISKPFEPLSLADQVWRLWEAT